MHMYILPSYVYVHTTFICICTYYSALRTLTYIYTYMYILPSYVYVHTTPHSVHLPSLCRKWPGVHEVHLIDPCGATEPSGHALHRVEPFVRAKWSTSQGWHGSDPLTPLYLPASHAWQETNTHAVHVHVHARVHMHIPWYTYGCTYRASVARLVVHT